jgi:hypothetical protein
LKHYATSWKVVGLRPDKVNKLFFTFLNLAATPWPPNRNDYQKQNKHVFGQQSVAAHKADRHIRLTTSVNNLQSSTSQNPIGLHGLLQG